MTATNGTGPSGTGDHPLPSTIHLLALCAFAIAQPLFEITGDNPTFFVAHRLSGAGIVLLVLLLVIVPPAVLGLAVYGVRLVSPRAAAIIQALLIGVLAVLVVYPFIHRSLDLRLRYQAALIVLGVAAIAYCYWRYAGFRRFVTWTWPAPLVFALVFLFFSPIRGLLAETSQSIPDVEVTSSTPVVLIVFDEFPLSTILDESGQINGDRYPNFHSLAQQSTWYRHATTVHHHSRVAVTAILTGVLPEPTVVPTLENHPRNLFTLLQSSYRIHAREVLTNLCPGDICTPAVEGETRGLAGVVSDLSVLWLHVVYPEQLAARYLPEIGDRWTGFATNNQEIMEEVMETVRDRQEDVAMETWLEGVSGSGPALHYLHVLIPHTPWRFLPTGQEYDADFFGGIFIDSVGSRWRDGIEYSAQGMQRASLQTAFADRFLGQLIDHLETDGIWDETMLIVVADHGMSFIPDTARRNLELDSNAGAILPIPLFVKYPNQTEGVIDDRLAQTIDVLPTVVDVLGIDLDWDLDGESLRGATTRTNQVVITSDAVISAPDGLFDSAVDLARLNASILGDGSDPYDLYAVGDHRHLVGSRAEPGSTPSAWMATISSAAKFREVHPEAHVIPARVTGSLEGGNGVTPLALAVGQRVVSTTLSYFFPDDQDWRFSFIVPPELLPEGCVSFELYEIPDAADGELQPIAIRNAIDCGN